MFRSPKDDSSDLGIRRRVSEDVIENIGFNIVAVSPPPYRPVHSAVLV